MKITRKFVCKILALAAMTTAITLIMAAALYKPLPEGFTKTTSDRIFMHITETTLRLAYYYPAMLFSKPTSVIWWTRNVLEQSSKALGVFDEITNPVIIKQSLWNGIPVQTYQPQNRNGSDGAVIFIHGGGFAFGSVAMYNNWVRKMSSELGTFFVSIEYRLAHEAPFPGGLNDCEAAVDYLFENGEAEFGINTNKVVVMGDSAGGNLATVIAQRRTVRQAVPKLAGQVLVYPLLQFADMQTISSRYYQSHLNGFALADPESVVLYSMFYLGIDIDEKKYLVQDIMTNGHVSEENKEFISEIMSYRDELETEMRYRNVTIPARPSVQENLEAQALLAPFIVNPDVAPLFRKDLSGLPPTVVLTCEFDTLRDEGFIYSQRLSNAGVPVQLLHFDNGFHAMFNFYSELDESRIALKELMTETSRLLQ